MNKESPVMKISIKPILLILQELLELHRQLIALGKEKGVAVGSNHIDTIASIMNHEKKCIQRITESEQQRIGAVQAYFVAHGLEPITPPRMEQLVQTVHLADEKRTLLGVWTELQSSYRELREINDFNQHLVRLQLEYLHFAQDLLSGSSEDEATYHRELQGADYRRHSRFEART
jgi:flagellar biosynthesis/type III secretory pathway chaperone